MEVDTGAVVSILPYREYKSSFNHLALRPSRVKLKTYSGERITPVDGGCGNQGKGTPKATFDRS